LSARREPGAREGPWGKRQADRSDVRQEFARFAKPEPVFELEPSGRAPALHASEYLAIPALNTSLPFRPCEADAAALVGRLDNAFHPAMAHHSEIIFSVKQILKYGYSQKPAPALIGPAVGGSSHRPWRRKSIRPTIGSKPNPGATAQSGDRAYGSRFGEDLTAGQSGHSNASAKIVFTARLKHYRGPSTQTRRRIATIHRRHECVGRGCFIYFTKSWSTMRLNPVLTRWRSSQGFRSALTKFVCQGLISLYCVMEPH
jgi:hypothetical protein